MMSLGQHPMTGRLPLGEGWDRHAQEWIAWARTGLDPYETFHRDVFLPLVPRPGRLTVDVGCGEGRVSRDLRALGHRVLAVDMSAAMTRAAATRPAGFPRSWPTPPGCRWPPAPPTARWRSCPCMTSTTCRPPSGRSLASSPS